MDSLTQISLGAAIGAAVLSRQVGRRAILWGAFCGTLPDLDVLIPLGDAIADYTYHRSFSHSVFCLLLISPLITWLILKIHPQDRRIKNQWFMLVTLALITHPILDSFTTYGTQIWWPLPGAPVSLSSIFIIDPLYSLPLIFGIIYLAKKGTNNPKAQTVNRLTIGLSSLYLLTTVGMKQIAVTQAQASLRSMGLEDQSLFVSPTPFNSMVWRIVSKQEDQFFEGYYSLFDANHPIHLTSYPTGHQWLGELENSPAVRRLQWFSKGYMRTELKGDQMIISDVRIGASPDYIFSFAIATKDQNHQWRSTPPLKLKPRIVTEHLSFVWQRLFDPSLQFLSPFHIQ